MSLIGRYILREILVSTILVMTVLLVIFMSNQFAETLGDAASDALPRDAVFTVLGLQFLRYLALLAPIGILLGILLGLARLNRDSEMAALAACGVGPGRLLVPVGCLSVVVAAGVGWLALVEAPAASSRIEREEERALERFEFGAFVPDRFTLIDSGSTVIYPESVTDTLLRGVFVQSETEDGIDLVLAEQGEQSGNPDDGEISLTLRNGRRYEGVPGSSDFYVTEFGELGMPIRLERRETAIGIGSRATADLLRSADPESRAELEWRLASPVSVIVLALLAVPLGRSSPREGKYARLGLGLLIYVIYANTLQIARVWLERELVPSWIGTWWVHGLLAALALLLLVRQSGIGTRAPRIRLERHEPVA